MTNQQLQQIEEFLDSRWQIALRTDERMGNQDGEELLPNNPDAIYYRGAIKLVEVAGLTWTRDSQGSHILYR